MFVRGTSDLSEGAFTRGKIRAEVKSHVEWHTAEMKKRGMPSGSKISKSSSLTDFDPKWLVEMKSASASLKGRLAQLLQALALQ